MVLSFGTVDRRRAPSSAICPCIAQVFPSAGLNFEGRLEAKFSTRLTRAQMPRLRWWSEVATRTSAKGYAHHRSLANWRQDAFRFFAHVHCLAHLTVMTKLAVACMQRAINDPKTRLLLQRLVDCPFSTDRSQSVGADAVVRDLTHLGHTVVVHHPLLLVSCCTAGGELIRALSR